MDSLTDMLSDSCMCSSRATFTNFYHPVLLAVRYIVVKPEVACTSNLPWMKAAMQNLHVEMQNVVGTGSNQASNGIGETDPVVSGHMGRPSRTARSRSEASPWRFITLLGTARR
jgi:hypothetical protein